MNNESGRYELKFVFDEAKLSQAMQWLECCTDFKSSFPDRRVNSLYFDDVSYQSVRDNLAGVAKRNKTRLRWYGDTSGSQLNPLTLEQKIRDGRLGYKKLYPLNNEIDIREIKVSEISSFVENHLINNRTDNRYALPIFNDCLFPTLYVEYSRKYFEDKHDIRITIDDSIIFRSPIPSTKILDGMLASYPLHVMEIKFPLEKKPYVSDLLRKLHFTPKRHSKYLIGLSSFGVVSYL